MKKVIYMWAVVGAIMMPARSDAAWVVRSFRILDLNMAGEEQPPPSGWFSPLSGLAWFIGSEAANHRANVVTLQEVCATQYATILAGLRYFDASWTGTYKNFGNMDGCPGSSKRHGLAIFTRGVHSGLESWYLSDPDWETIPERWWGLMKVHYQGVDIFNTHIMKSRTGVQIPEVDRIVQQSPLFLLAGDFNARPGEPVIDSFYDRWVEIDADSEYTYPRWPSMDPKKIDYVWTNRHPVSRWADVIDAFFSNHRMVKGVFTHWVWTGQ